MKERYLGVKVKQGKLRLQSVITKLLLLPSLSTWLTPSLPPQQNCILSQGALQHRITQTFSRADCHQSTRGRICRLLPEPVTLYR